MHSHNIEELQHTHDFSVDYSQAERQTKLVFLLTTVTMIAEIAAGTIFGSMALLADGWHMATHAAAFLITIFTYQYAKTHINNPKFTFGTGKVSILGGFASAVGLAVIALMMVIESLIRFIQPHEIQFNEAIYVTVIGLIVNLVSALLLQEDHQHSHNHDHSHGHAHKHSDHVHHDQNLRAAYFHVLADALTSILAIIALLSGKFLGWIWMDPIMGFVGAFLIVRWSYQLIQETSVILLDGGVDKSTKLEVMNIIEGDRDNRIVDFHIWNVSQNHLAAAISLVTTDPQQPTHYKQLLKQIPRLSHVTIEVNSCQDESHLKSTNIT